ncbi:MAG: trypsin-like peptidase domain-containing protein [Kiritimatiellae bacterium]|nr:trypsin-like peptidase domain-containing protein [Kiritimatiellia bacterium]
MRRFNTRTRGAVAVALCLASALAALRCGGAEVCEQAVVRIVSHYARGNWYAPWDTGTISERAGSGFVIRGKRILTNAHLVSDATVLLVYFHNDPTPYPARVESIGHDCDLALIVPQGASPLDAIPALEFGALPPIRSTVFTYGYPAGGDRISSTAGVVSRVEMKTYVHSAVDVHLAVQTDAAINPGNSGGPVVQDGKAVGVAFQVNREMQNMGLLIPSPVIQHFLTDLQDGTYDGFPRLGIRTVNMDSPAARRHAGMKPSDTGVRVDYCAKGAVGDGCFRVGDVITRIAGQDVANDGTILWHEMRLGYTYLVDCLQKSQRLAVDVLREGKPLALELGLEGESLSDSDRNTYDRLPAYLVYAGYVFVPLDREYLKTYGPKWVSQADAEVVYEFFYRPLERNERYDKRRVVALRRLDHAVNVDAGCFNNSVVARVNGKEVSTLEDMIEALAANTGKHHVIEYEYYGRITVLDREAADAAHEEILRQYGVAKDRRL